MQNKVQPHFLESTIEFLESQTIVKDKPILKNIFKPKKPDTVKDLTSKIEKTIEVTKNLEEPKRETTTIKTKTKEIVWL